MITDIPKLLGITDRWWRSLLSANGHASRDLALKMEREMNIKKDVFVFGSAEQRQKAVRAYLRRVSK